MTKRASFLGAGKFHDVISTPQYIPWPENQGRMTTQKLRKKIWKINRSHQILFESSSASTSDGDLTSNEFQKQADARHSIFTYAAGLLYSHELSNVISQLISKNNEYLHSSEITDWKNINYFFDVWRHVVEKFCHTKAPWGPSWIDYSHPIAKTLDDIAHKSKSKSDTQILSTFNFSLFKSPEYKKASANFIRSSEQERSYIKKFFTQIANKKKKIIICRFQARMDREFFVDQGLDWNLVLRQKISEMMKNIVTEEYPLLGYIHSIPPSNFLSEKLNASFSHHLLVFGLTKGNHQDMSNIIISSRIIQADEQALKLSPVYMSDDFYQNAGCGTLDLSSISSLAIIDDIADFMTTERRFLKPIQPKLGISGDRVAKSLQIHSFF